MSRWHDRTRLYSAAHAHCSWSSILTCRRYALFLVFHLQRVSSLTYSERACIVILLKCSIVRHRIARTAYVDAVCCYQPSSVVCRSVCRSVTLVSPAKTAKPIEMQFVLETRVDPGNYIYGRPIVKHRDTLRSSVQKRQT